MADKHFTITDEVTPEQIDTHVDNVLSLTNHEVSDHHGQLHEIATHEKTPVETLNKLHKWAFPDNNTGSIAGINTLEHLASNKNFPVDKWKGFLDKTYRKTDTYRRDDLHQAVSKLPGFDKEEIKRHIQNRLKDSHSADGYATVEPEFYEGLLSQDKDANHVAQTALDGLAKTKHTPESLERAKKLFLERKHNGENMEYMDNLESAKFVQHQPDLDHSYLDSILAAQSGDSWKRDSLTDSIVNHRNFSPLGVAKIVNSEESSDQQKEAALASPKLPPETRKAQVEEAVQRLRRNPNSTYHYKGRDSLADGLIKNPQITLEEITQLAEAGHKNTIFSGKAPDESIEKEWDKTDKKTDAANMFLRESKKLTPKILTDLVKHSNHDVALTALGHSSITEDVLNIAAKRRVAAISQKAISHPLIANKALKESFLNNKTQPSALFDSSKIKETFKTLAPETQREITKHASERLKGQATPEKLTETKESKESFWRAKSLLATSDHLDEESKQEHSKDITEGFSSASPSGVMINTGYGNQDSDITKAFGHLVMSGDKQAQDVFLNHPPSLLSAVKYKDEKVFPSNLLEKSYHKLTAMTANTPQMMDYTGTPMNREDIKDLITSRKADIAGNSNVPLGIFLNAMSDREVFDSIKDSDVINNKLSKHPEISGEEVKNICNAAWRNGSPEAKSAVLLTESLPKDQWRSYFSSLTNEDKDSIFQDRWNKHLQVKKVMANADNETLRELISGKHDTGSTVASKIVTQHIDLENSSHKEAVRQVLQEPMAIGSDTLVESLTSRNKTKHFNGEYAQSVIDSLHPENQHKAPVLAAAKAWNDAEETGAEDLLSDFRKNTANLYTEDPHRDETLWSNLFNNGRLRDDNSEGYFVRELKDQAKTGNLDFLADFQGPRADEVREGALKHNLISEPKIKQLMASGLGLDVLFSQMSESQLHNHLHGMLKSDQPIAPETFDTIANKLNFNTLSRNSRLGERGSVKADNPTVKEWTDDLSQIAVSITKSNPDKAGQAIKALLTSSTPKKLSKTLLKGMLGTAIDSIQSSDVPDEQKNKVLLDIYNSFNNSGHDVLLKPSLLTSISKSAVQSQDAGLLIELARDPKAPAVVMKSLEKMAKKPEVLTFDQSKAMLMFTFSPQMTLATTKKLISNHQEKITTLDTPEDQAAATDKMITVLGRSHDALNWDNATAEAKSDTILNTLKSYSLKEEHSALANRALLDQLSGSDMSPERRLNIFKFLPSDDSAIGGGELPLISLDSNTANDPDIIENSGTGWKLAAVVKQAMSLTKENAAIISNRLLETTDSGIKVKGSFNLSRRVGNDPQDFRKVIRSMNDNEILALNEQYGNLHDEDLNKSMVHEFIDHLTESSNTPNQHSRAALAAQLLSNLGDTEDDPYSSEKEESYKNAVDRTHRIFTETSFLGSKQKESILRNLMHSSVKTDADSTLKLFDLINKTSPMSKLDGGMELLEHWMMKASVLDLDQWKECEGKLELVKAFLHKRGAITADLGEHLLKNFDEIYSPIRAQGFATAFRNNSRSGMEFIDKNVFSWIDHMDQESLDQHGLNLAEKIFNHRAQTVRERETKPGQYHSYYDFGTQKYKEAITSIFNKIPQKINNDLIHRLIQVDNESSVRKHIMEKAIENGIGGDNLIENYLNKIESDIDSGKSVDLGDEIAPVINAKKLADKHVEKVMSLAAKTQNEDLIEEFTNNHNAPQKIIDVVAKESLKKAEEGSLNSRNLTKLIQHPKLSEQHFFDLYEKTKEHFPKTFDSNAKLHPAFFNPNFGAKLISKLTVEVPALFKNVIDSTRLSPLALGGLGESLSKARSGLENILKTFPSEGMTWADAKKKFPEAERVPAIKDIFMKSGTKPVTPEMLVKEIKDLDSSKNRHLFRMTYGLYNYGLQQHNEKPSLVFQVNNSDHTQEEMSKNPKLWGFYQAIARVTNRYSTGFGKSSESTEVPLHPMSPHGIGWSRVDTSSGKDGWIIEEFQTDLLQKIKKETRNILERHASEMDIFGEKVLPEEIGKISNVEVVSKKDKLEFEREKAGHDKKKAEYELRVKEGSQTPEEKVDYDKRKKEYDVQKADYEKRLAEGKLKPSELADYNKAKTEYDKKKENFEKLKTEGRVPTIQSFPDFDPLPKFVEWPKYPDFKGQPVKSKETALKSDFVSQIQKITEGWQEACFDSIVKSAHQHGVKKLYMHGYGIRASMSSSSYNKDYVNQNIIDVYHNWPKSKGFQPVDYKEYPNWSKETLKGATKKGTDLPSQCWVLDIEEFLKKKGEIA